MFIVINLSGEIIGEFESCEFANVVADEYGEQSGRFAFVEEIEETV